MTPPDAAVSDDARPGEAGADTAPSDTTGNAAPAGFSAADVWAKIGPMLAGVAGMVLSPLKAVWAAIVGFIKGIPGMLGAGAKTAQQASTGALVETKNAWVDLGKKIGAPITSTTQKVIGMIDGFLEKFGVAHPVRRMMGLGVLAALLAALLAPVGAGAKAAETQAESLEADALVEAAGLDAQAQASRLAEIERRIDVLLSRKAHGEKMAGPTTTTTAPAAPSEQKSQTSSEKSGGESAPTTAAPSFTAAAPADGWTYGGATGPDKWGGLNPAWAACGDKVLQSPINIEAPQARPRQLPSATKPAKPTAARLVNYGRYLSLQFAGSTATIDGQPAQLSEVRLHTPSEHLLEGKRFPGELQFLFDTGAGVTTAWAVMLDPAKPSTAFGEAFGELPAVGQSAARAKVDPAELLPEDGKAFRYTGSLTTPGCAAGVAWSVFEEPVGAPQATLSAANAATGDNARPAQPSEGTALVSSKLFG